MFTSAELLSDFKFFANRTANDTSLTDLEIYRLLTLAQQIEGSNLNALFPRMNMKAPELMVTTDGGLTYQINGTDADGNVSYPFGHAEVYARNGSRELYGSTYGAGGDVVFEGNKIRLARGSARTFSEGPYIRYCPQYGAISAVAEPTLRPPQALELVVFRALQLWANRGGLRDPGPYQDLYRQRWMGDGLPGQVGLLGELTTQYNRSHDGALLGQKYWRAWLQDASRG